MDVPDHDNHFLVLEHVDAQRQRRAQNKVISAHDSTRTTNRKTAAKSWKTNKDILSTVCSFMREIHDIALIRRVSKSWLAASQTVMAQTSIHIEITMEREEKKSGALPKRDVHTPARSRLFPHATSINIISFPEENDLTDLYALINTFHRLQHIQIPSVDKKAYPSLVRIFSDTSFTKHLRRIIFTGSNNKTHLNALSGKLLELLSAENMPALQHLSIGDNVLQPFQNIEPIMKTLTQICSLQLHQHVTHPRRPTVEFLHELTQLKHLSINVWDFDVPKVLSRLNDLEDLHIGIREEPTRVGLVQTFKSDLVRAIPNLFKLHIDHLFLISDQLSEMFHHLAEYTRLRTFVYGGEADDALVSVLEPVASLTHIELHHCSHLTTTAFTSLAKSTYADKLSHLQLGSCLCLAGMDRITAGYAIRDFERLSSLSVLRLHYDVGTTFLQTLSTSSVSTHITTLELTPFRARSDGPTLPPALTILPFCVTHAHYPQLSSIHLHLFTDRTFSPIDTDINPQRRMQHSIDILTHIFSLPTLTSISLTMIPSLEYADFLISLAELLIQYPHISVCTTDDSVPWNSSFSELTSNHKLAFTHRWARDYMRRSKLPHPRG